VRDLHFAWLLMGVLVAGAGGYAYRSLRHGRLRHARTEADGGSVFVGKPAMETAYWLIGPVVNAAAALGVTPNAVTLFSLLPAAGAGIAVGYGWFGLAALLAIIAQFADILDGLLARKLGVASDAGEALDAAVDRYVELFFLAGLAVHFRAHPMLLLVLAAIGGSFMVSYATAKAEALGVKAPRGVMRHGERVVYLLTASSFTPFARALTSDGTSLFLRDLPIAVAIAVVAVVANVSVVKRFAAIIAALRARGGAGAGAPAPAPALEAGRMATEQDVSLGRY
jgi:CDP-diacylglycerol--glycerol-3-phosphate 3-phosphatidyltransferase